MAAGFYPIQHLQERRQETSINDPMTSGSSVKHGLDQLAYNKSINSFYDFVSKAKFITCAYTHTHTHFIFFISIHNINNNELLGSQILLFSLFLYLPQHLSHGLEYSNNDDNDNNDCFYSNNICTVTLLAIYTII